MTVLPRGCKFAIVPLAVLVLSGFASPWARAGLEYQLYVAPGGNDGWSGTIAAPNAAGTDGPLATPSRARDVLRERRKTDELRDGAIVMIAPGYYELKETLTFSKEDGGTADAPVVYRASQSGSVSLVGGRVVSNFKPDEGAILKADLAAIGLGGVAITEVFRDGQRQPLARYPNFDAENPYGGGWAFVDGKRAESIYQDLPEDSRNSFQYREKDARVWAHPEEVEVFVFPRYNWWNNILRVKSIEREARLVTLTDNASYAIRPTDRYYIRNAREELDAPGEWYHDPRTSTLYYWPSKEGGDVSVLVPTLRTLVQIEPGTAYLSLRGLTLESATGEAVLMRGTTRCQVAGCTIRGVGDYRRSAVVVEGGTENRIVGNDIYDVGASAISLSGGDRETLTPAKNEAVNNYIHHMGVIFKQGVGIDLNGVGQRAAHNLIHDTPRMGILHRGNNHIIEYNHLRHLNIETQDTGAIDTVGRDWISPRGTIIRYNSLHDSLGFGQNPDGVWESPRYTWGVYLDDNSAGVDVIGNIIVRCSRAGLHLHNGRDNVIMNNIFVDNGLQQYEYSGWTSDHKYWGNFMSSMVRGWENMHDRPIWEEMRGMQIDPRKAVLPDQTIMSGNRFERNIVAFHSPRSKVARMHNVNAAENPTDYNLVWGYGNALESLRSGVRLPGGNDWAAWQMTGRDQHSVVADPKFVDPAEDDYRLQPDSPAFSLGFEPIPVEKIGPYEDELRATWPIKEAPGAREHPIQVPTD